MIPNISKHFYELNKLIDWVCENKDTLTASDIRESIPDRDIPCEIHDVFCWGDSSFDSNYYYLRIHMMMESSFPDDEIFILVYAAEPSLDSMTGLIMENFTSGGPEIVREVGLSTNSPQLLKFIKNRE